MKLLSDEKGKASEVSDSPQFCQAVEAAIAINPKLAIPMHYGSIAGGENDAEKFKKALDGKIDVMILPKS